MMRTFPFTRLALLCSTSPEPVVSQSRVFFRWLSLVVALLFIGSTTLSWGQTLSANMTFPQFNSSYISGTDINIQTTATTPAGTTITKVEFFYDAAFSGTYTKIGEDLTAPYSIVWTAPAVPAAGRSYQLRAVVTNSASNTAIQSGTGYNGISVYPASYTSTRNWYVSAAASATNTAGTEVLPVNTIQKAADRAAPGDIVYVMAGNYSGTNLEIVGIRRTGTPTQPIVFMPYQNDKPKLVMGNNNWNAINVLPGAAYVKIQGLEVVGNNANITLAEARTQPGSCEGSNPTATPIAKYNGNGISVNGGGGSINRPHHITLANNYVHDCGGAGIGTGQVDYVTIEDNITANNSWYTVYGTSGISVFNSWNYDNSTAPKMIVRRNRSFGNILKIAWNIGGTGTNCKFYDGNGIILDNNRATNPTNPSVIKNPLGDYTGACLVENNICYLNGGRGINVNYTDNALILNNTTYQNGQSDGGPGIGIDNELIMQGSIGSRIYNNIFYGKPGEGPSSVSGSSDIQQNNNLTFSNFNNGYFTGSQNIVGLDPQFVDAANGNFQLAPTSPAINAGSAVPGQFSAKDILGIDRPQGSGVDIGAYELQGTPIIITQQPASNSAVCVGASVSVSVGVSGPVQAYQWYKNGPSGFPVAITGVSSATAATLVLPSVGATDQGSYSVGITGFNSLTSNAFTLTVNGPPTATLTPASVMLTCANSSATLSASGGASYSFSTGETTSNITVTQAGTYSVIVTDANGCTASATATVVSNTATPAATLVNSGPLSCTSSTITLTAGGGTNYAFGGPNLNQSGTSATASVSSVGTYSVIVTGPNGCTASATTTVGNAINTPQGVNVVASSALSCTTPTIILTGSSTTPGVSYTFSGPGVTAQSSNTATVTQAGTYSVLVTSPEGCTASASVTVSGSLTSPDAPNASSVSVTQGSGTVNLTVTNCAGTVSWNGVDGGSSLAVSTTAVGEFVFSVTCKAGVCVSPITSVTVTVKARPATLSVSHRDGDNNQPSNNTIKPYLKLNNEGNTPIPYGELTLRYWLTIEDFSPLTNLSIYWAEVGTNKIHLRYVPLAQPRQGALGYIEYSFDASAGNLAATSNSGEIQTGVGKQNWTNLTETDDYSFAPNGSYTKTDRITVYQNGVLVGGVEPALITPVTTLKVYSENKNSSQTTNQISTYLKLANVGNLPVDYSQLTVRYWFSAEGNTPLVYTVDFAELGNNKINSKFVKETRAEGTDTYLEVSFAPTLGQLYPLSSTGIIQQRINKNDWSNFNEANDYSYKPAGALAENAKITAYLNGSLVYGQEPAAGARVGVSGEPSAMRIAVLGNPIQGDAVTVEVSGIDGQSARFELIDAGGQLLHEHRIEQAGSVERLDLPVGRAAARIFLLRVSTLNESQTIKFLKP